MTDVEVVELVTEQPVVLVHQPGDPLDDAEIVSVSDVAMTPGTSTPIGPAGGVLSGNYPNPGFAQPMATTAAVDAKFAAHQLDPAPHDAYDDIPSLSLLFASRLV